MENLIYLAIAGGIFLLGSLWVLFRHRERPVTFDSSIESFRDEMGALQPHDTHRHRDQRLSRPRRSRRR